MHNLMESDYIDWGDIQQRYDPVASARDFFKELRDPIKIYQPKEISPQEETQKTTLSK